MFLIFSTYVFNLSFSKIGLLTFKGLCSQLPVRPQPFYTVSHPLVFAGVHFMRQFSNIVPYTKLRGENGCMLRGSQVKIGEIIIKVILNYNIVQSKLTSELGDSTKSHRQMDKYQDGTIWALIPFNQKFRKFPFQLNGNFPSKNSCI